jgi:hypothetical protein
MKKMIVLGAILFSLSSNAQQKESKIIDSTIEIKLSINEYRAIMSTIDANIDSKKLSKEILEFIAKNANLVLDKPKDIKPKQ